MIEKPTIEDLVMRYQQARAKADAAKAAGVARDSDEYTLSNALGMLRRAKGTQYHRPGPNGREWPLTPTEIHAATFELRTLTDRIARRMAKTAV